MNWWQRLRRRERLERELDAELEFHVDQLVADLMREGLAEREARRRPPPVTHHGPCDRRSPCRDATSVRRAARRRASS